MTQEFSAAIQRTVTLLHNGDRDDARLLFQGLWERAATEGDAFDRTVLCHYMADTEDDALLELTWDLRALEAAQGLTDELLHQHDPSLTLASFMPSLHLNLAADYERLGDDDSARRHVHEAHTLVEALPNTDEGETTRAAVDRLAQALDVKASRHSLSKTELPSTELPKTEP
jgi:hypothetical protein